MIKHLGKGETVSKAALSTHLMQSYSVGAGPLLVNTVSELALLTKAMLSGGYWEDGAEGEKLLLPYKVKGQTATLDVRGTLIAGVGIFRWARIIDTKILCRTIRHLRLDGRIKTLKIKADSPGGVSHWVKECAEEVDRFNKTRGKKVLAYVDRCACSAMYWIIAPSQKITITSTATLGSVGVRITLLNQQKWYEEFLGEKYVDIVSGEFKAAGTDTREPTEKEIARFQEKVDRLASEFITAVAGYRALPEKDVREWEADTFIGEEAVEKGLADSVALAEEEGAGRSGNRLGCSTTGNQQMRGHTMSKLDELIAKHSDVESLAVESIYHETKAHVEKDHGDALKTLTDERDTLKTQVDTLTEELTGAKTTLATQAECAATAAWDAVFAEGGVGASIPEGSMRTALKKAIDPAVHTDEKGVFNVSAFTEAVTAEAKAWAASVAGGKGEGGDPGTETPEGGGTVTQTPGKGGAEAGYSSKELKEMGIGG